MKIHVGHLHPGPLDLFGTLVTSHIFFSPQVFTDVANTKDSNPHVPLRREWFCFSKVYESVGINNGLQPLPILTAVRHERPWHDWKSAEQESNKNELKKEQHSWWQWFEFSPIEFGSDELEGWIPMWAFGRHFENAKSTQRLPERSISLLLGICTSAPAGPLAAWLATIYRNLPTGIFGSKIKSMADEWVAEHPDAAERLQSHHPVHAINEANPFYKCDEQPGRGNGFENSPRIHLIDAGVSNNLPQYPFFRPHRNVDIMLLTDYSSDVQSGAALERLESFGKSKGAAILPQSNASRLEKHHAYESVNDGKSNDNRHSSQEHSYNAFCGQYAQVFDVHPTHNSADMYTNESVSYNQRHQPQVDRRSKLVYLPLLPHSCQPDYDPSVASFSSSYNLVWTEEQVATIRRTSRANIVSHNLRLRYFVTKPYASMKAGLPYERSCERRMKKRSRNDYQS